jgi:hypothetical protein
MYLRLRKFEMFEFHFLVLTQGVFLTPCFCSESTPKRDPLEPVIVIHIICLSITYSSVHIIFPYFQIIIIVISEVPDAKLCLVAGFSE